MKIAIENMMDGRHMAGRRTFGSSAGELVELLDAAKHDALGVCVDTSHASVQNYDIPAMIRELGPRVIAVHISDNDGSGDQHRTPGGGRVDWRGVVAALRDIGFAYDFNLENPGERHPDPEMRAMRTRHALEITEMLLSG
jgi:sugar phosphate isomerase/epimerase